ncbi:hypothetical protein MGG_17720 [Pyricularia oryzae 70-15]|uniref:Uncharacterized protein n=1 Tax=Pyricularia oryzae (strain 70-15 / ATCC MYA-4617 / FGSC 8958) TaxID=242507 RepID=G4NH33_PYRO7|nr:uncharacterized protein MGG_17720 [Pyricularia oryzae 70-15]EHA47543.1 hypothetical protein MGG_17720 [Pyricularia oryzae 70-15]KAI7923935.1 hypothetical protein M9X92_004069 [Pyricularia oryzae]KAI7932629.1 hypothetical protein M0657_000378 [Pyricularia oryzae]
MPFRRKIISIQLSSDSLILVDGKYQSKNVCWTRLTWRMGSLSAKLCTKKNKISNPIVNCMQAVGQQDQIRPERDTQPKEDGAPA